MTNNTTNSKDMMMKATRNHQEARRRVGLTYYEAYCQHRGYVGYGPRKPWLASESEHNAVSRYQAETHKMLADLARDECERLDRGEHGRFGPGGQYVNVVCAGIKIVGRPYPNGPAIC